VGNLLSSLFTTARIRQWIKNLALFTAITFTGKLFDAELFLVTVRAFIIFCLISSGSYFINDILDANRDRLHPFKKFRPIAAGALPIRPALVTVIVLYATGLILALPMKPMFFLVVCFYILIHFLYSFVFKNYPVLDILTIATAYFLRVLAGEAATGFSITVWLRLTVMSLSLFLAVGKRRAELTLIAASGGEVFNRTRLVLGHYTEKLLDVYTAMFANATWIAYAFYTFLERPPTLRTRVSYFLIDFFPTSLERKWLMLTIPFVLYGIMRYMQIIYEKSEGESPEKILLSDRPLLADVIGWALAVIGIIYVIGRG
jgi:4-hydroxybenzoate polyprenyltransferase